MLDVGDVRYSRSEMIGMRDFGMWKMSEIWDVGLFRMCKMLDVGDVGCPECETFKCDMFGI